MTNMDGTLALIFSVALAVLQIVDIVTTVRHQKLGARESNPILRWLFKKIDVLPAMLLVKPIPTIGIIWVMLVAPQYWLFAAAWCAIMLWVVLHNLEVIEEAKDR